MSTLGEALKGIKQLLLLQEQVKNLERAVEINSDQIKQVALDVIGLDKRMVRIETMIEMAGRSGGGQTRITE